MKTVTPQLFLLIFLFLFPEISRAEEKEWQKGIVADEFIFPTLPVPSVHAATIVETPSGLVVAFFGGEYEGHPEVSIYVSRHNGNTWSQPEKVIEGFTETGERKACYNPVLFRYPDGELLLFYKIGKNVQDWSGHLVRSLDDGKTWSSPEALPKGILGPIKNKPELIGSKLICPSSTENNGWQVHFEFTEDRGRTWRKSLPINSKPWNIIQPSILRLKNNILQVICRSQNEQLISASPPITAKRGATRLPFIYRTITQEPTLLPCATDDICWSTTMSKPDKAPMWKRHVPPST